MTVAWRSLSVLLPVRYVRQRRLRLVFGMLKPRSGQTRQEGYDNADRAGLFDRDDDVDKKPPGRRVAIDVTHSYFGKVYFDNFWNHFAVPLAPQTGVPS